MASTSANNLAATPHTVLSVLSKLGDADPDFRYMSLNDLLSILNRAKHDFLQHDFNVAARAADAVVHALDDANGEVQNLAVKCIGPLATKLPSSVIPAMLEKLSHFKLKNSVDNSIPALALRAVIISLPHPVPGLVVTPPVNEAYTAISRVLIPQLIGPGTFGNNAAPTGLINDAETSVEAIGTLIEVVRCFGSLLQPVEVEAMAEVVLKLLEDPKGSSAVKKRAVIATSMLAVYLGEAQLDSVVKRVTLGLSSSTTPVLRRLYISIIGSLARSIPARLGHHLPQAAPLVLQTLSEDELQKHMEQISEGEDVGQEFNDVREAALVALEAFLAACPVEMRPFTQDTIASCLRYLKYDPNYAADDEDEDMDVDEDEEEDDEDDEFEDDDEYQDDEDDDASWKVRRCAAKALYTLIATRGNGDLLDNGVLYGQAAPPLIKRFNEREENVRLEVLSAVSLLVRKTGEGVKSSDVFLDDMVPETVMQTPVSRKRRRQSSAGSATAYQYKLGLSSPVTEKAPTSGPRADLARLIPTIIKVSSKLLKGKAIPTKQSVINLLDDVVFAQRGGLADYFKDIIDLILETIKPTGSGLGRAPTNNITSSAGGSASATPGTLKIVALKFISNIARTHSSSLLQPYLSKIVASVASAIHDSFYKISSEAILTAEELAKALTPPRAKDAGASSKAELEKLYDVVMERGSANDADAEVRQRSIHAIGVILARTSASSDTALLSKAQRDAALEVLRERLHNETTRLAAVRAVDMVGMFANSPDDFDTAWIQDVVLELSAQLRKSNRTLKGYSVVALKHLVLSKAAKDQLESETIQQVVTALMPSVTNCDTQLLGPTLIILAHLVPKHAELIATQETITAICELLKSHIASIVLDQLLELVNAAGNTAASAPLMKGLLSDVSIKGDPAVTGKVIGTLLVAGGSSSGVTVDSFISELTTSSQSGDNDRVSLALAVLGEVGMRLGANSPLKPDLFLSQFHGEPDKVSLAAAVALGRAGCGNVKDFLPVVLEKMHEGGNTQYLLIQSIKEILQSVVLPSPELNEYAKPIWDQLLVASSHPDNRVVCAECVGRLLILDPKSFMPKLQTLLKDQSLCLRAMAVQAVRYTLPENDEGLDLLLRGTLIDMLLVMLQDKDMEIRRLAMTTLNSAAHNKPDLILPHLGELMPYVLQESVIKPELIKEVMLGPFKHTVDDGLEVRKSAYETLYALMEIAFSRISNITFYDRIIAGLKDENDIRQLCNLMVSKLIIIDADGTARRLDSIAEAYRTVLSVKLKENAVKQDVEKQEEANKSVLRVTLLLGDKMKALLGNSGAATSNVAVAGMWTSYWEWVNKDFASQLKGLREEAKEIQTRMV